MYIEDIAARIEEMIQAKIIIADIEKISYDEENILSQITQRYVEKFHKHKREKDKKQEENTKEIYKIIEELIIIQTLK